MDVHPRSPSPDNHEQIVAYMQSTGESARLRDMMLGMQRKMNEEFASINDGLGPPTKSKFTIREAAELTGLKRHTIRNRISRGEIRARLSPDGGLWFIPREEVKKLMPDRQSEDDRPESNEAPTTEA